MLADRLAIQAFDTDDFFWRPTDPPFRDKRKPNERLSLMHEVFVPRSDWVLAGSLCGWGDPLIPHFTRVVFLTLAPTIRLTRLRRRERMRHGAEILPGGPLEYEHRAFIDYAMGYDLPGFTGRSRLQHEQWLEDMPCPVLRLDATPSPADLADRVIATLDQTAGAA